MNVGDKVEVVRCDSCPRVVGRTAVVLNLSDDGQQAQLTFGRGRPLTNRPRTFAVSDLKVACDKVCDKGTCRPKLAGSHQHP